MRAGKVSESVLKRSVLRQIKQNQKEIRIGAGIGEDCAVFAPFADALPVTCLQEAAVATKADMERLLFRCSNNLAAAGAKPIAAMIGIFLPCEAEEDFLKEMMKTAAEVSGRIGMQIAGGHTTVGSQVSQPIVSVTAFGKRPEDLKLQGVMPGQDIVVSKWIGLEGTAFLAQKYREELSGRYPSYLVEEACAFYRYLSVEKEAQLALQADVCAMHDVSEGGIFAALWEMAQKAGVGLQADLRKIPIRQETVEVCEQVGANPYELCSSGSLLMTAWDGEKLAETLRQQQIPAQVIGKITKGNERLLLNEDEVRYLDKPAIDEIFRIGKE